MIICSECQQTWALSDQICMHISNLQSTVMVDETNLNALPKLVSVPLNFNSIVVSLREFMSCLSSFHDSLPKHYTEKNINSNNQNNEIQHEIFQELSN